MDGILYEMFAGHREPAWHRKGTVFQQPMAATEALVACGADRVEIETRRMGYQAPDGAFYPLDNRVVIFRKPLEGDKQEVQDAGGVHLGEASNEYTVLQNREIAAMMDASGLTKRWPTETVGVLANGATLFISLDMGEDTIASELHKRYFLFRDTRDGTSGVEGLVVNTRVVCQNTLHLAMQEGVVKINLQHDPSLPGDLRFSFDIIDAVLHAAQQTKQKLEELHQIRIPHQAIPALAEDTYPLPRKGQLLRQFEQVDNPNRFDPATLTRLEKMAEQYRYRSSLVIPLRETAIERYNVLCQEHPVLAGTGLGWVNAVAEVADHTRVRETRPSMSFLYGEKAAEKARSYRAVLAFAGVEDDIAALSTADA